MIAAQRAIAVTQAELTKCDIKSPIDGIVLSKHVSVGELVSLYFPKPLLTLAEIYRYRVRAEVDENDVPLIHVGQKTDIVVAAGLPRLHGVVTSLAPVMGRQNSDIRPSGQERPRRKRSFDRYRRQAEQHPDRTARFDLVLLDAASLISGLRSCLERFERARRQLAPVFAGIIVGILTGHLGDLSIGFLMSSLRDPAISASAPIDTRALRDFCETASFRPGDMLRQQGQYYRSMYWLTEGLAKVDFGSGSGAPPAITVGAGWPIGEISFLRAPRQWQPPPQAQRPMHWSSTMPSSRAWSASSRRWRCACYAFWLPLLRTGRIPTPSSAANCANTHVAPPSMSDCPAVRTCSRQRSD